MNSSMMCDTAHPDAPPAAPVGGRPQPIPAGRPTVTAAEAAVRQAIADLAAAGSLHARLTARGWIAQGLPYDPAGDDAAVTVGHLLRDVAAWRTAGRDTLFAGVAGEDGRALIQPYTRLANLDAAQRELWQRETARPWDLDALRAGEAHEHAELWGAC